MFILNEISCKFLYISTLLFINEITDMTPSFKYAQRLNQWKGAHGLGQTNTRGHRYNSFFCYTKRASVRGCHVR